MSATVVNRVARYYASKLAAHGPTPKGVDWSTEESQMVRFEQLMSVIDGSDASVCDYGCGYGAFLDFMRARGQGGAYVGFDAAKEMVETARALHAADPRATFVDSRADLKACDYTVASGIFNVRLTTPVPEWQQYMEATIDDLASLSRRGFAFNVLTSYSDADKMRADLYYADPRQVLDHCLARWPRRVAVLHDYGLYEFTVRVRL
jgi:SAM-dependent methyltransferase